MKIAISIDGGDPQSPFDPRFGRAVAFCVCDTDDDTCQVVNNPALSAAGGAGVRAAQFVAEQGVSAVVSGAFGPNAYETLVAANIKMYVFSDKGRLTALEVLSKFKAGELTETLAPTHAGHHEKGRGRGRG